MQTWSGPGLDRSNHTRANAIGLTRQGMIVQLDINGRLNNLSTQLPIHHHQSSDTSCFNLDRTSSSTTRAISLPWTNRKSETDSIEISQDVNQVLTPFTLMMVGTDWTFHGSSRYGFFAGFFHLQQKKGVGSSADCDHTATDGGPIAHQ